MINCICESKQIVLKAANKTGGLTAIASTLADKGINVMAVAGYPISGTGDCEVLLVTDNNSAAMEALKAGGCKDICENDVIIADCENKPGILKAFAEKLSGNGIDLKLIYGTAPSNAPSAALVFIPDNIQKALTVLKD
ncbi:hypothetical protein ACFLQ8_03720 [Candidatus Auribacterota bacterium]